MLICTLLLLLLAPILALVQPRFDFASTQTQLSKSVLPMRVQLTLDLDPTMDAFEGDVRFQLRALQAVPAIVLHARALEADSVTLVRAGLRPRELRVLADDKVQTWRLEPVDGLPIAAAGIAHAQTLPPQGHGAHPCPFGLPPGHGDLCTGRSFGTSVYVPGSGVSL